MIPSAALKSFVVYFLFQDSDCKGMTHHMERKVIYACISQNLWFQLLKQSLEGAPILSKKLCTYCLKSLPHLHSYVRAFSPHETSIVQSTKTEPKTPEKIAGVSTICPCSPGVSPKNIHLSKILNESSHIFAPKVRKPAGQNNLFYAHFLVKELCRSTIPTAKYTCPFVRLFFKNITPKYTDVPKKLSRSDYPVNTVVFSRFLCYNDKEYGTLSDIGLGNGLLRNGICSSSFYKVGYP